MHQPAGGCARRGGLLAFESRKDRPSTEESALEQKLLHDLAFAFSSAVDVRAPYTHCHSLNVSQICLAMCSVLDIRKKARFEVDVGGHLHDIGRLWISDTIVKAKGPLNTDEAWEMQRHPEVGYQIVKRANLSKAICNAVLFHHERWDGQGYPHGLKGEDIPEIARMIAVADAYEAMTSGRIYRPALSISAAKTEIENHMGDQFDPRMARALLKVDRRFLSELEGNKFEENDGSIIHMSRHP
jgi:HD-GYP domain-containing protein (c-di-GMP phosphodiesterase class II)